jgi:signal transduction histidine kinase
MRNKLSSTADGSYSSFPMSARSPAEGFGQGAAAGGIIEGKCASSRGWQRADRTMQQVSTDVQGEGLLHDARNLVSAIGLYCDLLSMPGVLRPEHQKYPEELRLLGTRSRVLIEHLMGSLVSQHLAGHALDDLGNDPGFANLDPDHDPIEHSAAPARPHCLTDRHFAVTVSPLAVPECGTSQPIGLRAVVERCSGLLSRVANGRAIEVIYGAAADVPIRISEEAIERILVNLVRNACAALDQDERPPMLERRRKTEETKVSDMSLRTTESCLRQRRLRNASARKGRAAIRILVGDLLNPVHVSPWPFQRVRLVVEDSGCGMESRQLHSLLSGRMATSRGTHGIGFRVVRELVAASNGDLCAASTPGVGTRVQIEWPVGELSTIEQERVAMNSRQVASSNPASPLAATEMEHHSIPPRPLAPTTVEGRQGTY